MKLLMPELERQLRAVVEAERKPARTPQRRPGVVLMVVGTATALAIAVLAVILIGHGRHPRTAIPAAPAGSTRLTCGLPPHVTQPSPEGPFKTIERGAVDGHSWLLQSGQNGNSVVAGRFVLDGRPFGFCRSAIQFHLIDVTPRGVTYGLAAGRGVYGLDLGFGASAPQPILRTVPGGLFLVEALPGSACSYRSLTLTEIANVGNAAGTSDSDFQSFGACRPGHLVASELAPGLRGSPSGLTVQPPPGLSPASRDRFLQGAAVAAQAGCLACHKLGTAGNDGPGPDLTAVGRRLSQNGIRRALLHPRSPMPAFGVLDRRALRNLIFFVSELKGGG